MIQKKHRIPSVATAALLLGGAACGDDDKGGTPGGSTSGVNVSSSRIEAIAKAYCELGKKCAPSEFDAYYSSISECAESYSAEFDPGSTQLTSDEKACLDAMLDYVACYAQTACDEDGSVTCRALGDKQDELCGYDYEYDYSVAGPSGKRARRMRIPKP